MEFNEFLKLYMNAKSSDLHRLSQYKMHNGAEYAKYINRIRTTEDFYRRNQQRAFSEGHSLKRLDETNFHKYEAEKDALDRLKSR